MHLSGFHYIVILQFNLQWQVYVTNRHFNDCIFFLYYRVCTRWKELTKDPLLWKNVNVKLFLSDSSRTTIAKSFINGLPSCVTSMRLEFVKGKIWNGALDFGELCMKLLGKCPHIEQLIVINSQMSNCLSSVISVCSRLLQDLKKLIFYHSTFRRDCSTDECLGTSKIKILELNNCYLYSYHSECPFSKMPHLEQLHLYGATVPRFWFVAHTFFLSQLQVLNLRYTFIDSRIFTSIQNHGHSLKELYLCSTHLQDHALTFTESMLPHLKTICLSDTRVTCVGVVSLIQTCPSLLNVYVNRHVADTFAVHPFVAANRSKAEIVKAIFRNHSHSVDYLYN